MPFSKSFFRTIAYHGLKNYQKSAGIKPEVVCIQTPSLRGQGGADAEF